MVIPTFKFLRNNCQQDKIGQYLRKVVHPFISGMCVLAQYDKDHVNSRQEKDPKMRCSGHGQAITSPRYFKSIMRVREICWYPIQVGSGFKDSPTVPNIATTVLLLEVLRVRCDQTHLCRGFTIWSDQLFLQCKHYGPRGIWYPMPMTYGSLPYTSIILFIFFSFSLLENGFCMLQRGRAAKHSLKE